MLPSRAGLLRLALGTQARTHLHTRGRGWRLLRQGTRMVLEQGTLGLVGRVQVESRLPDGVQQILGPLLLVLAVIMVLKGVLMVGTGVRRWARMRGGGRAGRCGICP